MEVVINKHDALRILISNKNNATIYYKDGTTIALYSDNDVRRIVEIVCLPIGYEGNYETFGKSIDDTLSLSID